MRKSTKVLLAAAVVFMSLATAPALFAHDNHDGMMGGDGMKRGGGMMGGDGMKGGGGMMGGDGMKGGGGMMGNGGMMGMMGMMGPMMRMMQHCNQMMQDGHDHPNHQWKKTSTELELKI